MHIRKKILLLISLCLCLISCSPNNETISYTHVSTGASITQIEEKIGTESNLEKKENGVKKYIYKKCNMYGYTGELTYYTVDDSLLFTRWEYSSKSDLSGEYSSLAQKLKKEYGNPTIQEENSYTFVSNEGETLELIFINEDENNVIAIVIE